MAETPGVVFHESPGLSPPAPAVDRSRRYTRILLILFLCTLPLVNPIVHGDGVGYYTFVRAHRTTPGSSGLFPIPQASCLRFSTTRFRYVDTASERLFVQNMCNCSFATTMNLHLSMWKWRSTNDLSNS